MPGGIVTDDDFWRLLSHRDIVREPITERYGRGYQPIGGFSGPGRFGSAYEGLIRDDGEQRMDPGLFGVSLHEMTYMDPQIRMLLGCAWEACERAGWDLHALRNSPTGVFIGAQVASTANWRAMYGTNEFSILSIDASMLANRISYHLNLMGPSISCSTACSASLSALHTAVNAIRLGDCDRALVGGATYLGSARCSASFNALGVISPDGRCHSFDADANGYMRSEGSFVFAIKALEAAVIAHRTTGAPLFVHLTEVPIAEQALEVLGRTEPDWERVVFCHMDFDIRDLTWHRRVLARGVNVEFDFFGSTWWPHGWYLHFPTDPQRLAALSRLADEGYAGQLLVSHDVCTRLQLTAYGGFGYGYLRSVVPGMMEALGLDTALLDRFMIENTRRVLTG